jgi:hypothetical protein
MTDQNRINTDDVNAQIKDKHQLLHLWTSASGFHRASVVYMVYVDQAQPGEMRNSVLVEIVGPSNHSFSSRPEDKQILLFRGRIRYTSLTPEQLTPIKAIQQLQLGQDKVPNYFFFDGEPEGIYVSFGESSLVMQWEGRSKELLEITSWKDQTCAYFSELLDQHANHIPQGRV